MLGEEIAESLIEGDAPSVKRLTEKALAKGVAPDDIVGSLTKGMEVVGAKFREMEISLPEVLMSARAMYAGLEKVRPLLSKSSGRPRGVVAIGTIFGDIHDIGKNIVTMMLEGAGFHVIDLGIDVSIETFIDCVRQKKPDIMGMSALLTVTMENMRDVMEVLKKEGLRDKVKVMVGGAPVSQKFADEIGADAYGEDAHDAVEKAKMLLGIR